MDIEWAKDGRTGELFIVQARPETVQSRQRRRGDSRVYRLQATRAGAGRRAAASARRSAPGRCASIQSVARPAASSSAGEVLVTDKTDPDWEPIMKKAAAIVTNRGGRTCHAAIVSRELGVPAVVGTERGTELLTDGQVVTVSLRRGRRRLRLRRARCPSTCERVDLATLARPRTKVMMNVGNPERGVPRCRSLPNDGVGLARDGVHHLDRTSRSTRWPWSTTTASPTRRSRRRSTALTRRLRRQAAVLRRQAGRGRRP